MYGQAVHVKWYVAGDRSAEPVSFRNLNEEKPTNSAAPADINLQFRPIAFVRNSIPKSASHNGLMCLRDRL